VRLFRTDGGRDFQTDGAAELKECLLKVVRRNGTCSSGADDEKPGIWALFLKKF